MTKASGRPPCDLPVRGVPGGWKDIFDDPDPTAIAAEAWVEQRRMQAQIRRFRTAPQPREHAPPAHDTAAQTGD